MRLPPIDYDRTCLLACGALPPVAVVIAISLSLARSVLPSSYERSHARGVVTGARSHIPVEVSPDPVALGRIPSGTSAESSLTIYNSLPQSLCIKRIETSCPCVTVGTGSMLVASSERKVVAVRYDPSEDPDFVGDLSVDVTALGATDEVVFRVRVDLEVGPKGATGAVRRTAAVKPERRSAVP
jgi:hypothetical protein